MTTISDERIAFRKREFKTGLDSEICKQKRVEVSRSLRKNKRQENLSKRRNVVRVGSDNTPGKNKHPRTDQPTTFSMEKAGLIYSSDQQTSLKGLKYVRQIMSVDKNPPTTEIVDSGLVTKLIEYLTYVNYPGHQIEAAWVLTNLISGESSVARNIIDNTTLGNYMLELIKSRNDKLRDQAFWCIGNIAGEADKYRDVLLSSNCIDVLIGSLKYEVDRSKRVISHIQNQTWVLSNMFRGKQRQPRQNHYGIKALPLISEIYKKCLDEEVIVNLNWTVHGISNRLHNDQLDLLFESGIVNRRFVNMLSAKSKIYLPVLRVCGNIIAGPNNTAQKLIDLGFMEYLKKFVYVTSSRIRKEAFWIISNIAAGNKSQIQSIFDNGLIFRASDGIDNGTWEIKKECCYVLVNAIKGGTISNVKQLVDEEVISKMARFLSQTDNRLINEILGAFDKILQMDCNNGIYKIMIEEMALDEIEKLQTHSDPSIYANAVELIETYFSEISD